MRQAGRARQVRVMAAVLMLLPSVAGVLRGQEPAERESPAGADRAEPGSTAAAGDSTSADEQDLVLIQDEDGEWRAVPYSEEELLGNLLDQFAAGGEEATIAPVYISELALKGFVVEDRAHLTATMSIEVTVEGAAFDVPLRLNQAHVHTFDRTGPGRASPILDAGRDDGLHWRFEGRGTHFLEIAFWVPLIKSPAGHQLLLTLPALPEYLVTRIELSLPGDQLILRRPPDVVDLQQGPGEGGTTVVTAEVAGQRLELTWRERRESTNVISSVHTRANLRRDGGQLLLSGEQEIAVEQDQVSEFLLRLPREFTVEDLSLASPRTQATVMYEPLPEDDEWLRVMLSPPLHQRFTVEWTLRRPFPDGGGAVRIDGLDVANAASTQGEILLNMVDGYSVSWNEARSRGVRRVGFRDDPARGAAWGAFKFENPFELDIDIQPIAPETTSDVTYFLRVEADKLLLTLDVSVQVLTGSIQELEFDWPVETEERWAILSDAQTQVSSNGETVPAVFSVTTADDGVRRGMLTLSRPISGTLSTRLRLMRDFPADESVTDVTLPLVDATGPGRPRLFIAEAIDVSVDLNDDSQQWSPVESAAVTPESMPEGFVDARVRGWDLTGNDPSVACHRTRHPRSVSVVTSVTIGAANRSVLQVAEEFRYNVEYGRVETMLYEVPEPIREVYEPGIEELGIPGAGLRFLDESGEPLTWTNDGNHYSVSLPAARHGVFVVRLEYALPRSASRGGREEYDLPIVQPLDAEVSRTAVHAAAAAALHVVVPDADWQSIPDFQGGDVWHVAGSRSEVPLELEFAAGEFAQRFRIPACFLQTTISKDGSATTFGVYELLHPPGEVLISLPPDHSESEFRWNDSPVVFSQESEGAAYLLTLPDSAGTSESGRLVVIYRGAATTSGAVAEGSIGFPSFGPDVRIDETIWEVVLPYRHLLSGIPETMMPEFHWQRQTILWMRSATEYVETRRQAILGELVEDLPSSPPRGNRYAFSATGSVSRVHVQSMTQSLVVLVGAGMTMLLGFVFGRFPAARRIYWLLVLGFLFSIAGVWSLELMQLLAQPALIGLGLALLAVKFDTATRTGSVFRKTAASRDEPRDLGREHTSSVPGAVSSGVARTDLYGAASSDSGSGPHD